MRKKESTANGPSVTEEMIESFPDAYREYLSLESYFCDARSRIFLSRKDESKAWGRFNELIQLFRFDSTRQKYKTVFWEGKQVAND